MLSEVVLPKKKYAITIISAEVLLGVLFFLANIAYVSGSRNARFMADECIVLCHQER